MGRADKIRKPESKIRKVKCDFTCDCHNFDKPLEEMILTPGCIHCKIMLNKSHN